MTTSGLLLAVLSAMIGVAAGSVVDGSAHAEAIDVSQDSVVQEVRFAVERRDPGAVEVTVDTAALPDGITVNDATVSSSWDAQIVEQGQDRTSVDVDSGSSAGDAAVEIRFDLDASAFDGDNQEIAYTITGTSGGSTTAPVQIQREGQDGSDADEPAEDVDDPAGPQAVVYVTVLDPDGEPLPADEVDAWAQQGLTTSHGEVQDDGAVRLSPSPGTYTLRADADGYAPGVLEDVELEDGERTEPYQIRVQDGGTLTGTVTDTDGNPVGDVTVEIEGPDGVRTLAHTDSSGTYEIMLAPGSYSVRASDDTRVSDAYSVVSISDPSDTATADFTLQAPEIVSADVQHVDGTEPDMDAFDLQTVTQGGMVFVELGAAATGSDREDAFTPQDLSQHGVDASTRFEITLTVNRFDPDALIWAAKDADWEATAAGDDTADITVTASPVHMETIDGVHTGPTTDGADIAWPSGGSDTADTSYEQAVQFALIEIPGLNPAERETLRGMSATTNAQAFGFPRVDDGELSVYLGAPGEQVDGDQHTGFYRVFLPDNVLDGWDVDDPERELEALWQGDQEAFAVDEVTDGAYVEIDPITYSDGTFTLRSTVYSEGIRDMVPTLSELRYMTGQLLQDARIWIKLRLPV